MADFSRRARYSQGGRDGLDRLNQAFEYTKTTSRYGGLLVARHGHLVYEHYFGRASRDVTPNMFSCGKMFISCCLGILMKENPGAFPDGLSQKVFTPKYLPEAFRLSDPRKAAIELGHLLTMTSGMADSGIKQSIVQGEDIKLPARQPLDPSLGQDASALQTPLWTAPGGGYCYSTQGVHVASIILRHLVGMEAEQYIRQKIAAPLEFGGWGYARQQLDGRKMEHTPGGYGIALRATDALRFAYLLLKGGRWKGQQVLPADYLALCKKPSPFNPHSPYSLQFEVNEDRHVAGAPPGHLFQIGCRRLLHLCLAVFGSGCLQDVERRLAGGIYI